jgi:hypothetical protein
MSFASSIESPFSATEMAKLSRDGPCGNGGFDELIALPDVQALDISTASMINRFIKEEFRLGGINAS